MLGHFRKMHRVIFGPSVIDRLTGQVAVENNPMNQGLAALDRKKRREALPQHQNAVEFDIFYGKVPGQVGQKFNGGSGIAGAI